MAPAILALKFRRQDGQATCEGMRQSLRVERTVLEFRLHFTLGIPTVIFVDLDSVGLGYHPLQLGEEGILATGQFGACGDQGCRTRLPCNSCPSLHCAEATDPPSHLFQPALCSIGRPRMVVRRGRPGAV